MQVPPGASSSDAQRGMSSESSWWLTLTTSAGRKGFVNLWLASLFPWYDDILTYEYVLLCCDRMIKSILRPDCWTLDSHTQWSTGEQYGFSVSEFCLSVCYWVLESNYFSTSRFLRADFNSQVFKISFMENTENWNHNPVFPFNILVHFRENSTLWN